MRKFQVKLSDEDHEDTMVLAKRLGLTMADVIRDALAWHRWHAREVELDNQLLVKRGDGTTPVVAPNLERLRPTSNREVEVVGATSSRRDDGRTGRLRAARRPGA